jgi:glyoxalase family protein
VVRVPRRGPGPPGGRADPPHPARRRIRGSLDFWEQRLGEAGRATRRGERSLGFSDHDGLAYELVVSDDGNPPLRAEHPGIPAEHAVTGVEGARAYTAHPLEEDRILRDVLGFSYEGEGRYRLQGDERHFHWGYDPAPQQPGRQGAGSVHHIAWASQDDDHLRWQQRVREAGGNATEVRDRDYFRSIYFAEPRGVLFEIATMSPGFAADEDPERLGEELRLPSRHEHLRPKLERILTPLANPRATRREQVQA